MIKNIRKYLEYFFLILINIGLTFFVYSKLFIILIEFSYFIATKITGIVDDSLFYDDPTILILILSSSLALIITKLIFFQVLYIFKKKLPYIHNFFYNVRINKDFKRKVLYCAFLIDIVCCLILKNIFSLFFGLIFNYFAFLLIFPTIKKDKAHSDELGIIMTKIGILSIFIIFLFNILFFFFPFSLFLK